jgi:hypothetical protein
MHNRAVLHANLHFLFYLADLFCVQLQYPHSKRHAKKIRQVEKKMQVLLNCRDDLDEDVNHLPFRIGNGVWSYPVCILNNVPYIK